MAYMCVKRVKEANLSEDMSEQLLSLKTLSIPLVEAKYRALWGRAARIPTNRTYLIRQIAYKMQELSYGSVSVEMKAKLEELIKRYDPINKAVCKSSGKTVSGRDTRIPLPGSFITKQYKGQRIEVKVLDDGFEYHGAFYKNLTAIAQIITGAHWNGFIFFGLRKNGKK